MNRDVPPVEAEKDFHRIISGHIVRLRARLTSEPDVMKRQILQARIDNLVIAQKQFQARLMVPGHA